MRLACVYAVIFIFRGPKNSLTFMFTQLRMCATLPCMNAAQLVALLEKRRGNRDWKALAAEIGVSDSFLSRVRNGWCGPGKKVLGFLGLREEITYVPVGRAQ